MSADLNASVFINTTSFKEPITWIFMSTFERFMAFIIFFLFLLSVIFCSAFIFLLHKVRPFHQNLSILLENMAAGFVLFGITNLVKTVEYVTDIDIRLISRPAGALDYFCFLTNAVYCAGCYVVALTPFTILLERTIATIYAKTYETNLSAMLGVVLSSIQWIFALVLVLLCEIFLSDTVDHMCCQQYGFVYGSVRMVSCYALIFINIIGVPAVITLRLFNKKQYSATSRRSSHSLSQRYQLSENIKTTRFIFRIVTVNFCFATYGILLTIAAYQNWNGYTNRPSIAKIVMILDYMTMIAYDILLPIYAIFYPVLCTLSHPALRCWMKKKSCLGNSVVAPYEPPRNVDGKSMIHTNERDLHFAALSKAWN